jgi:enoyl-CoA hydratase/carnithine racemase
MSEIREAPTGNPRKDRPTTPTPAVPLVLVEWRGPVVLLTLNNPPLNILTTPLLEQLGARLLELTNDPRARALVITGSGDRAFSGGANVREMLPMTRATATRHSALGQGIYNLIERAPFPVIAAVRGFCVGGGCEMVQACDFILASEDAFFGQPEINIGVIPGWGGSRRLTRTIGAVRARRWIMTGDRVGAAQALQDGFLDRIVPAADLLTAAVELGNALAAKSADAVAAAKYLVNHAADPDRDEGLAYERRLWGALFETEGQREGMRAFIEKRPARYASERTIARRSTRYPWGGAAHPGRTPPSKRRSTPAGKRKSRRT